MTPRVAAWCIALLLCAGLGYGIYRVVVHAGNLHPAIVTPQMDAQQEVSPSVIGYAKRLANERVSYNDRAHRPKLIALTFDDGPYPIFTPLLLDELAALKIPATFFLIGYDAQRWPTLARRIEQNGDEIGDHTLTHPFRFDAEDPQQIRDEIVGGRDALLNIVADPSIRRFFRPPHGRYTLRTIQIAQSLGYTTVLWNDDGGDWRPVTPAALAEHIERFATAPDIVLLHNGKPATIAMLPEVAKRFRAAGYRFVTVGELLRLARVSDINHPAKRPV